MTESNTKKVNKPVLLSAAAVACLLVLGVGFWMGTHPSEEPLYGVMQAKTVDVAAKVTGRVETLPVHEGDTVSAGQLLMTLDIPEVEAKLKEVEALKSAATARQSLVDEGARPQEIRAAKAQMQRAQAGQELAQKTFNRVHALYREGLISKQKHDEALAQKKSADELLAAAKEQYDIALTGARTQEKQELAKIIRHHYQIFFVFHRLHELVPCKDKVRKYEKDSPEGIEHASLHQCKEKHEGYDDTVERHPSSEHSGRDFRHDAYHGSKQNDCNSAA